MSEFDVMPEGRKMYDKNYSDEFLDFRKEVEFVRNTVKSYIKHNIPKDVGAWLRYCVEIYNKIPAIKEIMWCTGLNLKEAKTIFELIELRYHSG